MKYLKIYEANRRNRDQYVGLKEPKDLDEEVTNICMPFTDKGLNLEVSHHYGTAFYNLFPSTGFFYYKRTMDKDHIQWGNSTVASLTYLSKHDDVKEKFFSDFTDYINHMKLINDELPEFLDRISELNGLTELDIDQYGSISFRFSNKPSNEVLGKNIMLAGDPAKTIYRTE